MRVAFELPDPLWWQVADMDIPAIIVAAIQRAADTHEVVSSITRKHAEGMCDADIGTDLGMTVGAVAEQRRALGLPANRRYTKRTNERKAS